jgi:hypothetical protein
MNYKCYRCFYKSKKSNVLSHLNRKKICSKSIDCEYNDDEIELLNKSQFNKKKSNSNIQNNIQNQNIQNIQNQNIQNIQNIQNQNIINNTIKIDNLIPFNEDWDISHITEKEQRMILFSNFIYTTFYKNILKNDSNSNIIIDEKTKTCRVYKNDDKNDDGKENIYKEEDLNVIIQESMIKLNKQLKDIFEKNFCEEYKPQTEQNISKLIDFLEDIKKEIDEKFNNFMNIHKIKDNVNDCFSLILKNNQDVALQFLINKNEDISKGY